MSFARMVCSISRRCAKFSAYRTRSKHRSRRQRNCRCVRFQLMGDILIWLGNYELMRLLLLSISATTVLILSLRSPISLCHHTMFAEPERFDLVAMSFSRIRHISSWPYQCLISRVYQTTPTTTGALHRAQRNSLPIYQVWLLMFHTCVLHLGRCGSYPDDIANARG